MSQLWRSATSVEGFEPPPPVRLPPSEDFERSPDGLAGLARECGLALDAATTVAWTLTIPPRALWLAPERGLAGRSRGNRARVPRATTRGACPNEGGVRRRVPRSHARRRATARERGRDGRRSRGRVTVPGALDPVVGHHTTRSNAAVIARASSCSWLSLRYPRWRPRADTGMVAILSRLTTQA